MTTFIVLGVVVVLALVAIALVVHRHLSEIKAGVTVGSNALVKTANAVDKAVNQGQAVVKDVTDAAASVKTDVTK